MNYKTLLKRLSVFLSAIIWAIVSLSCEESLPIYVAPTNILSLRIAQIEQLNNRQAPPSRQAVHIKLIGENIHDEVFQDSVNIKGSLRIWWKRKPERYRTMYLTLENFTSRDLIHNGRMLLLPGQQFTVEATWDMKTDDSVYVASPTEMNFAYPLERVCDYNIACADPEAFVVEASLNVYDRIGYVVAEAKEFSFVGKVCILCGRGPFCFPPPGSTCDGE